MGPSGASHNVAHLGAALEEGKGLRLDLRHSTVARVQPLHRGRRQPQRRNAHQLAAASAAAARTDAQGGRRAHALAGTLPAMCVCWRRRHFCKCPCVMWRTQGRAVSVYRCQSCLKRTWHVEPQQPPWAYCASARISVLPLGDGRRA